VDRIHDSVVCKLNLYIPSFCSWYVSWGMILNNEDSSYNIFTWRSCGASYEGERQRCTFIVGHISIMTVRIHLCVVILPAPVERRTPKTNICDVTFMIAVGLVNKSIDFLQRPIDSFKCSRTRIWYLHNNRYLEPRWDSWVLTLTVPVASEYLCSWRFKQASAPLWLRT